MRLAPGLLALLLLPCLGAACATSTPPRAVEAPPAPARADAAPEPSVPPGFALRGRAAGGAGVDVEGGLRLELVDGARVLFDPATGVARAVAPAPGVGAVHRVPARLGGGLLFVGEAGISTAASALDAPRSISRAPARDVSFGPSALVVQASGARVALDLSTGAARRADPPGVTAWAGTAEGLVVALLEGGSLRIATGASAPFAPLERPPRRPIAELGEGPDGSVRVVDVDGAAFVVRGGALVEEAAAPAPRPARDPRWKERETPLELAATQGGPLGDARVAVAARGSVFVIDRGSGAIVSVDEGVLPPRASCQALSLGGELLFACRDEPRLAIFVRAPGGEMALERTFLGPGRLVRGGGATLLFSGACEGSSREQGVACVRERRGVWHAIDRSKLLSAAPASTVVAWIPTETSALAITRGGVVGILDAKTGERTVLEGPEAQQLTSLVGSERSDPVEHRFRVRDGGIDGYSSDGAALRIEAGGKRVSTGAFRFPSVRVAGGRALAVGPDDTLWQSLDWGQTFAPVAQPEVRLHGLDRCGEVGCLFSRWIRATWDGTPPAAREEPPPAAAPREPAPAPLPRLACGTAGPQTRRAAREPGAAGLGAATARPDEGVVTFRDGPDDPASRFSASDALRATDAGPARSEGALADVGAKRAVRHLLPFDPQGAIQAGSLRLGDLVDAAHAAGAPPPNAGDLAGGGLAIPVLTPRGGKPELLLVRDGGLSTWLSAEGPRAFATSRPDLDLGSPVGAARLGDGAIAVLFQESDGHAHVVRMGAARADRIATFAATTRPDAAPATLDALALDEAGAPRVVRIASREPPAAGDAWLLGESGPAALAAWSTLALDGTPPCAGAEGVRAIVHASPSWIQLGAVRDDASRMRALVRWSGARVCLEAVELSGPDLESPSGSVPSRTIAVFGAAPAAGLVAIGEGVELREPRRCELLAPG